MRLVDADKLKEDVLDLPNCPNEFSDTYDKARILDLVDEQPAVDAVEVVRCENCKWFGEEDEDGECWCFLNDVSTLRYGFCYWGKQNDVSTLRYGFCYWGKRNDK